MSEKQAGSDGLFDLDTDPHWEEFGVDGWLNLLNKIPKKDSSCKLPVQCFP